MITLRRTVDFMTVLAAAGLLGGLGAFHLEETRFQERVVELTGHVRSFEQMIKLRAATKDVELNGRGWPVTIDPAWFGGDAPRNSLLTADRPWVEVAPPEDAGLSDPRIRIALDERYASFWYNPYQGIVRARVPLKINDSQMLAIYNQVNGTSVPSIYCAVGDAEFAEGATPPPGPAPAVQSPAPPVLETTEPVLEEPAPPVAEEIPEPDPDPAAQGDFSDPGTPAAPPAPSEPMGSKKPRKRPPGR